MRDPDWRLGELPGLDLSAVWRRQWDWLRGARRHDMPVYHIDAAGLIGTDPHHRLATINNIALSTGLARAYLPALAGLLHDPLEPIAVDAAYAMAGAEADAVAPMLDIIRVDTEEDTDIDRGSHDGSRPEPAMPARSSAYGLVEIGAPAVRGLLDILDNGVGSRARKLAAFALGEIAGTGIEVVDALCRATQDPAAAVRINAIEALGLKPAAPSAVAALSRAIRTPIHRRVSPRRSRWRKSAPRPMLPYRRYRMRCTTRTVTCPAMPSRCSSASRRPTRSGFCCRS